MELVRIFKEHNVFGWVSVGTAILSLFILNLSILSDTIIYSYQMLPFSMAAIPLAIIELFIKKGRTGLGFLGVVLNVFILICVWTIVSIDTNLQLGF
ncbi:anti-sigma factor [Bacillus sp. CLL-7-23]|uniref:Anti-sigma factor n=1 Tax=Bacillus changyiensis TaxID=3004103 RepID=A0ABT4X783_9BACI|nr:MULTISPECIES: anti-sigma factor [Bacillus]MDA7028157.1 anti-sigma factor [Bacillus changyiensis]NPC92014.1 anti-sigma factor [Bacillus sp. WMMC1349]